ncbi:hypothetical protein GWC77_27395 [Paraburkholderia sp. NMBU_R16]|uniref:hypothetical protein n=1 Tax=Paraburkholderia sp. NMBU_R16 TaxID=2698676 RepID=UPI001563ADE9|nr:hypothetical protein [Paraburkholderia sp. NMBU_R16]NRO99587.1 hypothetical protein [Paraburkholderia sp. NMBU_R16]
MNSVAQAVAAIRKSPSFALMPDDEPVTLEALQHDIDALDAAWDALDDALEVADDIGDAREAESIRTEIAAMEIAYVDACNQLDALRAAYAADFTI